MKFYLKQFILLLSFCSLSACNNHYTQEYFLIHPEKIPKAYNECLLAQQEGINSNSKCLALWQAIPIFKANMIELMNSRVRFAVGLMQDQIKLVELQKMRTAKQNNLTKELNNKIRSQELLIESKFALIRLLTNT